MIKERISIEVGKIKGNIRKLWNLSKAEKLDRNECINTIREIDKSLANIINLLKNAIARKLVESEPEKLLMAEVITRAFSGTSFTDFLSQAISFM